MQGDLPDFCKHPENMGSGPGLFLLQSQWDLPTRATAPVGQVLLVTDASRSPSDTPESAGLIRTSDQPDADTFT